MQVAINLSSLAEAPLDEQLAAAAGAGFELVELRAPSLSGVARVGERLRTHGLAAVSINSLEGVGERDLSEEARRLSALAASCACPYLVAVPGRRREGLTESVAELALVCAQEGAELAFEFIGFGWSAARTLAEASAVHPGALVVDTFHWALGDGDLEALHRLDARRLAVVHVNDAPSANLAGLGDADRVPPGAGVLDLTDFYSALLQIGYEGVYSLEVFTPTGAERAFAAMSALA